MKYFDKTFWKMFGGFIIIIAISLTIIFATRIYQAHNINPVTNIANP